MGSEMPWPRGSGVLATAVGSTLIVVSVLTLWLLARPPAIELGPTPDVKVRPSDYRREYQGPQLGDPGILARPPAL